MKKPLIALALLTAALLAACGTETVEVEVTREVEVEATRLVEVEVPLEVTRLVEVEVTRIVEVTPIPTYTSIPLTPATPEPTVDVTRLDMTDGSYLVGAEIAPGIWRSISDTDPGEDCWLTIQDFDGDLIGITGELVGATIRVPDREAIVLIGGGTGNQCVWTFFQP